MLRKITILLICVFLFAPGNYFSADIPRIKRKKNRFKIHLKKRIKQEEHNKWVAAGLDVSLGLFGVHRLYLGTETYVPVMYTLTLGGGGALILTDLGLLLFTKDVENFADKSHVFMWIKED